MLDDVSWTFSNTYYDSLDTFLADVKKFEDDEYPHKWDPEEVLVNAPTFTFTYEIWLNGPDDLRDTEKLADSEDDPFNPEYAVDDWWQVEITATLSAPNGTSFTAGELLWLMHNQLSNKDLGDDIFFDGVDFNTDRPSYLALGS